ncbi:glycosyltransferase family 4 protein [Alkalinema pantanalense CENA528]|uniref:glycosyltransferase family 4 protein n=1 Tax=Alkalinema pantanalense TaxID=1620705 RepID=UPI003D6EA485
MRIAIVAPSGVPFCIGGAEKLWWGLLDAINQHTSHQAELIKVPSPEMTVPDLFSSYKKFSQLDLSHFDAVISGKYPAWMVRHPHHTCYMLHRLRGLYDTYHLTGLPEAYHSNHRSISALQAFMRANPGNPQALETVFTKVERLLKDSHCPKGALQFPGPLLREIIHFLDDVGLSPHQIQRYTAISKNLTTRSGYFPAHCPVEVIYPPSSLPFFEQGDYDYLFTVSRLDGAKRVRMLIEAMQHVQSPIHLKIAGTGPDEVALKALAAGDDRIEFLGFVNDRDVIPLYANALVVPFLPYDEDYGLVTIEAMMSGKPVLTTTDSGGPNEFVINGETGYSVDPNPLALAERIDYLYHHRGEAQAMGQNARQLVSGITWENTVTQLLQPMASSSAASFSKPKLVAQPRSQRMTVALTYPIYPPRGGGQSRVFHLYRNLTQRFEIDLVAFTGVDQPAFEGEIAPKLHEIRIPKSAEHQQQESLIEQKVGVPITDVVMPQLYPLTPAYVEALQRSVARSDVLVACHPYLYPALRALAPHKPIWYEAQDVEVDLKEGILPDNLTARELLAAIRTVEQACCDGSDLIFTCAEQDSKLLHRLYHVPPSKIVEVPNGVDVEAITYLSQQQRRSKKQALGLDNTFTVFFLGSWHGPNLEAVEHIFQMAQKLPQVQFLVVGSVGLAFQNQPHPPNVGFMGVVDDSVKDVVLEVVDVALNPITYGSGTNLKMLEYFAAGIPVISTPFGVRGLGVHNQEHCMIADLNNFPAAIAHLQTEAIEQRQKRVRLAHQHVETAFDWAIIADQFLAHIAQRV